VEWSALESHVLASGYWARSVAVESAAPLTDDVTEQRDRHRRGTLLAAFEQPKNATE
jgi:hypothetical protein